jgi:predicted kinase
MTALFFAERPADAGADWYMPRIERCLGVIWDLASQALGHGVPVVLEIGLTRKVDRQAFCGKLAGAGHRVALRVVEADRETRWRRVQERNRERSHTFAFEVTREMFDFVETMWEAPDDAELAAFEGSRTESGEQGGS